MSLHFFSGPVPGCNFLKKIGNSFCALFPLISIFAADPLPCVRADRSSAVYHTGETIRFTVNGWKPGLLCTVNDGVATTAPAALPEQGLEIKAERPGFLLVSIWEDKNPKKKTYAGAAIEPEKIEAAAILPADFDSFWEEEVKKLRNAPLEIVSETPVPASLLPAGVSACDVTLRRNGITATGFLAWPTKAAKHGCPGMLTFLGASKVSAELRVATRWAAHGAVCFNLNFQGLSNSTLPPAKFKKTQTFLNAREQTKNYNFKRAADRQKYAMRTIFLRTVMAADYLMQRPEFDGRTLVASGGSLGGCQALICTALVPQITLCVSNATAMCDHAGADKGHLPGWPNLLARIPEARQTSAYFDVANFTHRVKCPVFMAVGFIDVTCPPASTYAVYNSLKVPKKMLHSITSGHGGKCLDKRDCGVFEAWDKETIQYLNQQR